MSLRQVSSSLQSLGARSHGNDSIAHRMLSRSGPRTRQGMAHSSRTHRPPFASGRQSRLSFLLLVSVNPSRLRWTCARAGARGAVLRSAAVTSLCGAELVAAVLPRSGYMPGCVVLFTNGMDVPRSGDWVFRVLVVWSDLVHEGQRHILDGHRGTRSTAV